MQQIAFQQRKICPPPPIVFGGTEFRVDHIEFGNNSLRHSVQSTTYVVWDEFDVPQSSPIAGLTTQIAQQVSIFVEPTADILAHPNQVPTASMAIGVTAILDLAYYPIDDQCYLRAIFNSLEFGPFPPLPAGVDPNDLKQAVTTFVTSAFPSPAIDFSFANSLTGASVNVKNADVSVGGGGAFLTFMAQLGGLSQAVTETVWASFLLHIIDYNLPNETSFSA
jgi:hypothetical protein